MKSRPSFADVIAYNVAVVQQGLSLAQQFDAADGAFAVQTGPHLRHIIEHYDALLNAEADELIDYDHRARDRSLEQSAHAAAARLQAIIEQLQALADRSPVEPVAVGFRIGLEGSEFCLSPSTLVRELHFVASHAIHHYALIRPALLGSGICLPEDFGKAPDTVRYERLQFAT